MQFFYKIMITIGCFLFTITSQATEKLYIYNWTEYIPNKLIKKFTQETGIEVIYSTFESNEEMYSKLKLTDSKGYDLIFPSSYYIKKMQREGMLQKLDLTKIKLINNIDPALMAKEFDPKNEYSLPYIYGLTGIYINTDEIDASKINSWADLWDSKYKEQLLLINDVREVFHMALLLKGYSPNTTNPTEIKQAYELLTKLAPNIQIFNADSPEVPYVQGEVDIGMNRNGSAYRGTLYNPALKFIYPKEGAILWMDCIALPKHVHNITGAYKFIDFLLRPENVKEIQEEVGFSMPNIKLKEILPKEIAENPVLFPTAEDIEKSILQEDVGEAIDIYDMYWNKLRTSLY